MLNCIKRTLVSTWCISRDLLLSFSAVELDWKSEGGAVTLQGLIICASQRQRAEQCLQRKGSCGSPLILKQVVKKKCVHIFWIFFKKMIYCKCKRKTFLRTLGASQKPSVINSDGQVPSSGLCYVSLSFWTGEGFQSHGSLVSSMFPGGDSNLPVAPMQSVGPLSDLLPSYTFFPTQNGHDLQKWGSCFPGHRCIFKIFIFSTLNLLIKTF